MVSTSIKQKRLSQIESKIMADSEHLFSVICLIISMFILIGMEIEPTVMDGNIIVYLPTVGSVRGSITQSAWTNQTIFQFLAIPFAESPSKELRFKAPVARSKWNYVRDATKFGRSCPQSAKYGNKLSAEDRKGDLEDCLHLSVYTKDVSQKLPVMVYIHGGALEEGSSSQYPSNFLLEKDIVYVAVQYRLGALGFLSTRTKNIPGNMGVLDVILALEWIQKNINHFGGDPNQVTIFGNSAGACISSLLAVSPKPRKGLFQRVILQSGLLLMRAITEKNPIEKARNYCIEFSCKSCDKVEDINECFMQTSLEKLVNMNSDEIVNFSFTEFDYEGVFPKPGRQLVEESKNSHQIMVGVNKHEGAYLILTSGLDKTPRDYLDRLITNLTEDNFSGTLGNLFARVFFTADQLNQPKIKLKEMMLSYVDIASNIVFKFPSQQFLELYMRNDPNKSDNYLYAFDYAGEYTFLTYLPEFVELQNQFKFYPFQNGVHHADDLLYLFPWKKPLNAADTKIAKLMVDLWTSFAITGKPQYENGIEIPKVKNPMGPYFHISTNINIEDDFSEEFFVTKREKKISRV